MLKIRELKDHIKEITQRAKLKEQYMLQEKDEIEKYKEALLMKEQEAMLVEKGVQLELKKVQDLAQRIDQKVSSLQIPPPKYYFPPEPWSYVNGQPDPLHRPMVFCGNCQIHHHPHHHCNYMSECNHPPQVIRENYIYVSQTPKIISGKKKDFRMTSSLNDRNYFERNRMRQSLDKERKWIEYNELSKYYR